MAAKPAGIDMKRKYATITPFIKLKRGSIVCRYAWLSICLYFPATKIQKTFRNPVYADAWSEQFISHG